MRDCVPCRLVVNFVDEVDDKVDDEVGVQAADLHNIGHENPLMRNVAVGSCRRKSALRSSRRSETAATGWLIGVDICCRSDTDSDSDPDPDAFLCKPPILPP